VAIEEVGEEQLPAQGDVDVDVAYSSLNYKDGLAVTGRGKVIRKFPMVPGIDLAGTVRGTGEQVIVTGWEIGEKNWGGYAERARVQRVWAVTLPDGLSMRQAMAIGTAGFTAMLSVMALEEHGLSAGGDVVVTGATGGVGSVAVVLLSGRGYRVSAVTGRPELGDYLRELGAAAILSREEIAATKRPLASERWAGAVDTVGGQMLAGLIAAMRHRTSVAACGLAGGADLPTTVHPFILRGVNLLGIDSNLCPLDLRKRAWARLAKEMPMDRLDRMTTEIGLGEVPEWGGKILDGGIRGRVVVDVRK
jgi:acrylyl-CoA reductase (NADPH)